MHYTKLGNLKQNLRWWWTHKTWAIRALMATRKLSLEIFRFRYNIVFWYSLGYNCHGGATVTPQKSGFVDLFGAETTGDPFCTYKIPLKLIRLLLFYSVFKIWTQFLSISSSQVGYVIKGGAYVNLSIHFKNTTKTTNKTKYLLLQLLQLTILNLCYRIVANL